jgi:Carboxypeptidase regulatory-like domain
MNTLGRLALVLVGASTARPISAQNVGAIKGSVVSEGSRPIAGAEVCIEKFAAYPQAGSFLRCPLHTATDAKGDFRFEKLTEGSYTVSASKPEDGYGDPLLEPYFSKAPLATVTLSLAAPVAEATLDLGPQAAALLIPTPTDAISGKPVGAAIILWRLDNPRPGPLSGLTNGGYNPSAGPPWPGCCPADPTARILVPSDTDIGFVILASGYKPWPTLAMPASRQPDYYDVWQKIPLYPPSKEGILHLAPHEVYKLNVKMEPVSQ